MWTLGVCCVSHCSLYIVTRQDRSTSRRIVCRDTEPGAPPSLEMSSFDFPSSCSVSAAVFGPAMAVRAGRGIPEASVTQSLTPLMGYYSSSYPLTKRPFLDFRLFGRNGQVSQLG